MKREKRGRDDEHQGHMTHIVTWPSHMTSATEYTTGGTTVQVNQTIWNWICQCECVIAVLECHVFLVLYKQCHYDISCKCELVCIKNICDEMQTIKKHTTATGHPKNYWLKYTKNASSVSRQKP